MWVAPNAPAGSASLDVRRRAFLADDLIGASAVFACAPPATNAEVAAAARALGILCGRADDPDAGDFVVPAQLERAGAVVGVSTDHAGPAAARALLGALDAAWRPSFDAFLRLWAEARAATPPGEARQRAARSVPNEEILSMLDAGDVEGARARLRASLAAAGATPTETT